MTPAWPEELRFSAADKALHIRFDDAATFSLPYTYLRRESPSAEVQGHGGGPKPPPPIIADDIMVERAEAVGHRRRDRPQQLYGPVPRDS